jgi:5-methyltetrahydrofolate--homocysteine methyltransferase
MHTILRSASKEVVIGDDQPFCVIGERINPTGRKLFQEQLRAGDLSRVEIDVAQQVTGAAMVLDVNMEAALADEVGLMTRAVKMLQVLIDLPLCIDLSMIEALEAGLSAYEGKALVNSVTAEDARLEAILPLVKRYGAAVIGLPNDENAIPMEPKRRLELARKIVEVAAGRYGIAIEDIVLDPLAMPIAANTSLVAKALETISLIKDELGTRPTAPLRRQPRGRQRHLHALHTVFDIAEGRRCVIHCISICHKWRQIERPTINQRGSRLKVLCRIGESRT